MIIATDLQSQDGLYRLVELPQIQRPKIGYWDGIQDGNDTNFGGDRVVILQTQSNELQWIKPHRSFAGQFQKQNSIAGHLRICKRNHLTEAVTSGFEIADKDKPIRLGKKLLTENQSVIAQKLQIPPDLDWIKYYKKENTLRLLKR